MLIVRIKNINIYSSWFISALIHGLVLCFLFVLYFFNITPSYNLGSSIKVSLSTDVSNANLSTPLPKTHKYIHKAKKNNIPAINRNDDANLQQEQIPNSSTLAKERTLQQENPQSNFQHEPINYEDLGGNNGNEIPVYPLIARINKWEGQVILHATLNTEGKVVNVVIQTSSGYEVLDKAAVNAIKKWEIKHNSKSEMVVLIPIVFKINNT